MKTIKNITILFMEIKKLQIPHLNIQQKKIVKQLHIDTTNKSWNLFVKGQDLLAKQILVVNLTLADDLNFVYKLIIVY